MAVLDPSVPSERENDEIAPHVISVLSLPESAKGNLCFKRSSIRRDSQRLLKHDIKDNNRQHAPEDQLFDEQLEFPFQLRRT